MLDSPLLASNEASQRVQLSDISAFITKGSTPTTYGFEWQKEGVPFLRSECVGEDGFTEYGLAFIGEDANESMARSQLMGGDLLVTITGNVGRVARLPDRFERANMNQHIARVRVVDTDIANVDFVYYVLNSVEYRQYFQRIITGLAYPQLSLKQIRETTVSLPPLSEQQRIAEILTSVDDTIRATEAVIAQTERVKLGVMENLLTGGLGSEAIANGEVPVGWDVKKLDDLAVKKGMQTGPFGSQLKAAEYVESGDFYVIMPKEISGGNIDFSKSAQIDAEKASQLEKHKLQSGDILFARRGDLSKIALFDRADLNSMCGTGCLRCRPNSDLVFPHFLAKLLSLPSSIEWLEQNAVGQTMLNLNTSIISELPLVLPPMPKQKEVVGAIQSLEDKIAANKALLSQTKRLKQGLMSDLLTGKKRVV